MVDLRDGGAVVRSALVPARPMLDAYGKPDQDFDDPPNRLHDMALGDFDGDGDEEIAVTVGGETTGGQSHLIVIDDPLSEDPSITTILQGSVGRIAAADLTGNGIHDLAITIMSHLTLLRAHP